MAQRFLRKMLIINPLIAFKRLFQILGAIEARRRQHLANPLVSFDRASGQESVLSHTFVCGLL
jgi:hypothetical protein